MWLLLTVLWVLPSHYTEISVSAPPVKELIGKTIYSLKGYPENSPLVRVRVRVRVSFRVGGNFPWGAIALEPSESSFKIYVLFTTAAVLIE